MQRRSEKLVCSEKSQKKDQQWADTIQKQNRKDKVYVLHVESQATNKGIVGITKKETNTNNNIKMSSVESSITEAEVEIIVVEAAEA